MWEVIFASIALVISFIVLLYTAKSIRELISTQRAQTGPLIKVSILGDSSKENHIGPTNHRAQSGTLFNMFIDQKSGKMKVVLPSNEQFDLLSQSNDKTKFVIGELPSTPITINGKKTSRLIINIENIQEHLSGVASDLTIEIVGWWSYHDKKNSNTQNGRIHLKGYCELVAPNEKKSFYIQDFGKLSMFRMDIKHLSYRDIWGHKCYAYFGHKGCIYLPAYIEDNAYIFYKWESATSDISTLIRKQNLHISMPSPFLRDNILFILKFLFRNKF
jgi:hypothetical protein